jgi:hypothetical protein
VKYHERENEDRARFCSSHAAQARNVREQVTNDNRLIGKEGKEAPGHQ